MEGLTLIIVIALFLLFGKSFIESFTGVFTQPNAKPTPYGLPADAIVAPSAPTTQNQLKLNTANAPAPWTGGTCNPVDIALAGEPKTPVSTPSPSLPFSLPSTNYRLALPTRFTRSN